MPAGFQARVQQHLQTVLLSRKMVLNTDELLRELSGPLRDAVALHRCQSLLMSPNFISLLVDDAEESNTIDRNFIKNLVTKLELAVFAPGDLVTEEGDTANQVYFLASGRMEVRMRGRSVAQLGPGACFGEIAVLIPHVRRTATIIALTFSETHELTRDHFMECLDDFPVLKQRITTIAEQRLHELQKVEVEVQCPLTCPALWPLVSARIRPLPLNLIESLNRSPLSNRRWHLSLEERLPQRERSSRQQTSSLC